MDGFPSLSVMITSRCFDWPSCKAKVTDPSGRTCQLPLTSFLSPSSKIAGPASDVLSEIRGLFFESDIRIEDER